MKRMLCGLLAVVLLMGLFAGVPLRAEAATTMTASPECIEFIKQVEGFYAIPYWDYAQWTVGFGTKCPDADLQKYKKEGIPVEEAERLLQDAMVYFGNEVNKFMVRNKLKLTQQQFDALFSLSYNIGPAWMYDANNKLVQAILNGTGGNELIYLMGLRCNAGGEFLPALLKRRMMEADMYLNGRYEASTPVDYGTVLYNPGSGSCEARGQGYDMNLPAAPLAVPTYKGYKFLGWYTEKTGGLRITVLDETTDGMTLYAHWEKNGVADNISGTAIETVEVKVTSSKLQLRTGPGISYSVSDTVSKGTALVITAVTERNGGLWGKCKQGWVSLAHTDYRTVAEPEQEAQKPVELPVDATVLNPNGIDIYNGPHTTYPKTGKLPGGRQIKVLELKEFVGKQWARYEGGWVRVDHNLMLHDETTLTHSVYTLITNNYLNVRSGPGTEYSLAGSLNKDDRVQIVAVTTVGSSLWGRCYKGWISLSYTDFDQSMLPRYQNHTYKDWYDLQAATCTASGNQRRDCIDCDHFETRITEAKGHTFTQWYENPDNDQQQRRDCTVCHYSETRKLDDNQQTTTRIYGTVTGCEVLNIRSAAGSGNAWVGTLSKGDRVEIFEQVTIGDKVWGRMEKGWICITGYVTLEEVTEPEDQQPEQPPVTEPEKVYGTLTGYYTLNIRSGPGTQYALVGALAQGDRVEILEQKTVGDKVWGRIDRGWICITGYMTLETVTEGEEKVLMTVTAFSLNIRSGPGSGYSVVGTLYEGEQVEVLEQKTVDGKVWARIDRGWVSMKYLK